MKDLDQCQNTCMKLLRMDNENDSATVMMADLSYRRNEYETAMYHFQQLLGKCSMYFKCVKTYFAAVVVNTQLGIFIVQDHFL